MRTFEVWPLWAICWQKSSIVGLFGPTLGQIWARAPISQFVDGGTGFTFRHSRGAHLSNHKLRGTNCSRDKGKVGPPLSFGEHKCLAGRAWHGTPVEGSGKPTDRWRAWLPMNGHGPRPEAQIAPASGTPRRHRTAPREIVASALPVFCWRRVWREHLVQRPAGPGRARHPTWPRL